MYLPKYSFNKRRLSKIFFIFRVSLDRCNLKNHETYRPSMYVLHNMLEVMSKCPRDTSILSTDKITLENQTFINQITLIHIGTCRYLLIYEHIKRPTKVETSQGIHFQQCCLERVIVSVRTVLAQLCLFG